MEYRCVNPLFHTFLSLIIDGGVSGQLHAPGSLPPSRPLQTSCNVIHGINPYMFRHQGAIFRGSTKTKKHKSNMPIQVLIALTVIIKILKF
jgi:hypothetical protein